MNTLNSVSNKSGAKQNSSSWISLKFRKTLPEKCTTDARRKTSMWRNELEGHGTPICSSIQRSGANPGSTLGHGPIVLV